MLEEDIIDMKNEIFKNRKKIFREFPNEDKREIEIHFTLV